MPETGGGLLNMLGLWFLLIAFFITIGVAIKVLLGGSSGSKPEQQDKSHNNAETDHGRSETQTEK